MFRFAVGSLLVAGLFVALGCGGGLFGPKPYLPSQEVRSAFHAPTQVVLFSPPDSQVAQAFAPYLQALDGLEGVSAVVVDRADASERARALGVDYNGVLVVRRGDRPSVVIDVGFGPGEACKVLPVLDDEMLAILERLDRPECDTVFVPGDGFQLIDKFIEGDLGHPARLLRPGELAGTTACVVVARGPLSEADEAALRAHLARGGNALLLVGPGGGVGLDALGITASAARIVDDKAYAKTKTGGLSDRRYIVTDQRDESPVTGNGPAEWAVLLPDAVALDVPASAKVAVRSMPTSWVDADGNLQPGPSEARASLPVAATMSTPQGGRVVVVGSTQAFTDTVLGVSRGNIFFLMGASRWLLRDEYQTDWMPVATPDQVKACRDRLP